MAFDWFDQKTTADETSEDLINELDMVFPSVGKHSNVVNVIFDGVASTVNVPVITEVLPQLSVATKFTTVTASPFGQSVLSGVFSA